METSALYRTTVPRSTQFLISNESLRTPCAVQHAPLYSCVLGQCLISMSHYERRVGCVLCSKLYVRLLLNADTGRPACLATSDSAAARGKSQLGKTPTSNSSLASASLGLQSPGAVVTPTPAVSGGHTPARRAPVNPTTGLITPAKGSAARRKSRPPRTPARTPGAESPTVCSCALDLVSLVLLFLGC